MEAEKKKVIVTKKFSVICTLAFFMLAKNDPTRQHLRFLVAKK